MAQALVVRKRKAAHGGFIAIFAWFIAIFAREGAIAGLRACRRPRAQYLEVSMLKNRFQ